MKYVFRSVQAFCTLMSRLGGSTDVHIQTASKGSRYLSFLLDGSPQNGTLKPNDEISFFPSLPYIVTKGEFSVELRTTLTDKLLRQLAIAGIEPNDFGDKQTTASLRDIASLSRATFLTAPFHVAIEGLEHEIELSREEQLAEMIRDAWHGSSVTGDELFDLVSTKVPVEEHVLLKKLCDKGAREHNSGLEVGHE